MAGHILPATAVGLPQQEAIKLYEEAARKFFAQQKGNTSPQTLAEAKSAATSCLERIRELKKVLSNESTSSPSPTSKSKSKSVTQKNPSVSSEVMSDSPSIASLKNKIVTKEDKSNVQGIPKSRVVIPIAFSDIPASTKSDSKEIIHSSSPHSSPLINASPTSSSSSSSITPSPSPSRNTVAVMPPARKQLEDIRLLQIEFIEHCRRCALNSSDFSLGPPSIVVFLVSGNWWRSWENYTFKNQATTDDVAPPSEIDNWDLIEIDASKKHLSPSSAKKYNYKSCKFHLKAGLKEDDFVPLSQEAWEALFSWYGGGPPIPRCLSYIRAPSCLDNIQASPQKMDVKTDRGANVVAFLKDINCIDLYPASPPSIVDILDFSTTSGYCLSGLGSKNGSSNDLENGATSSPTSSTSSPTTPSTILSTLLSPLSPSTDKSGNDGKHTERDSITETPCSPSASPAQSIITSSTIQRLGLCFVCRKDAKYYCVKCKGVYYCDKNCQRSHWDFHKHWCKEAAKECLQKCSAMDIQIRFEKRFRSGRVGLMNLGNSCYISSCLQCLSHIMPLTTYFLSGEWESHINTLSVDSKGGAIAREYCTVLKNLWFSEEKKSFSPSKFKATIGRVNGDFAGLTQQDAHEFCTLLLDYLHEDVNRIVKKPYVEEAEGDGSNDAEIAKIAWEKYRLRDDSKVRDTTFCLLRNKLNCPDCGKVSVKFDGSSNIAVSIPLDTNVMLPVIFVPLITDLEQSLLQVIARAGQSTSLLSSSSPLTNASLESLRDKFRKDLRPTECSLVVNKVHRLSNVCPVLDSIIAELPTTSSVRNVGGSNMSNNSANKHSLEFAVFNGNGVLQILPSDCSVSLLRECKHLYAFSLPPYKQKSSILVTVSHRIFWPQKQQVKIIEACNEGMAPMFFSVDSTKSTCADVRKKIWCQIIRLLKPSSEAGRASFISYIEELRKRYRKTSDSSIGVNDDGIDGGIYSGPPLWEYLPIRMKHSIKPAASSRDNTMDGRDECTKKSILNGLSSDGDLSDPKLGVLLPYDNDLLFSDFFDQHRAASSNSYLRLKKSSQETPTCYLSVDWSGMWLDCLDRGESFERNEDAESKSRASKISSKGRGSNTSGEEETFTLEQCLHLEYSKEELLEKDNAWYCSVCSKHQLAQKSVKFWREFLPDVLIISLKRFNYGQQSFMGYSQSQGTKISNMVDFPLEGLDMAPYCCEESLNLSDTSTIYDLFGVCNHFGRMGFGHYTAFARDGWLPGDDPGLSKTWKCFDDDSVSTCDESEVKTRHGYILFYRKRKI